MLKSIQAITALLVGIFFFSGANGLLTTVLALKSQSAGFEPGLIGLLVSGYYLGFIIACMTGSRLIALSGHIRAFAAFASLASVSVLLHSLIIEPVTWILLRVFSGYCYAILLMATETWLSTVTPAQLRGSVFSIYRIIELSSITLAQLSLWVVSIETTALFILIAICISLSVFPITQFRSESPGEVNSPELNIRKLLDVSPLALAGTFAIGLAMGSFWGLSPVLLQKRGFEAHMVGWFISTAILGGAIWQWPLGRLSDKIDRRRVIIGASLAASLVSIILSLFASADITVLLLLAFLFGGFSMPLYSLCISHAYDLSEPGEFVEVAGSLLLFFGIGAVCGPATISLLMGYLGDGFLFTSIALIMLILAIYGMRRLHKGAIVIPEFKNEFVGVVPAEEIFELDPRAEESRSENH